MCTFIEDIQAASCEDTELQELKAYKILGWPHKKEEVDHSMRKYWPLRNELAIIDGISMKGKTIIIPFQLHKQILLQWHNNHIGIEKMRLLVQESVY